MGPVKIRLWFWRYIQAFPRAKSNIELCPWSNPQNRLEIGPFGLKCNRLWLNNPIGQIRRNQKTKIHCRSGKNLTICVFCWKNFPWYLSSTHRSPHRLTYNLKNCLGVQKSKLHCFRLNNALKRPPVGLFRDYFHHDHEEYDVKSECIRLLWRLRVLQQDNQNTLSIQAKIQNDVVFIYQKDLWYYYA